VPLVNQIVVVAAVLPVVVECSLCALKIEPRLAALCLAHFRYLGIRNHNGHLAPAVDCTIEKL
jgi:hypothetical protein